MHFHPLRMVQKVVVDSGYFVVNGRFVFKHQLHLLYFTYFFNIVVPTNYSCVSTHGGAHTLLVVKNRRNQGLLAGGSLLVDYMLTVAVSVSAGAEAIISAIPALYGHQVAISIGIVILITLMRREAARICFVLNVASV